MSFLVSEKHPDQFIRSFLSVIEIQIKMHRLVLPTHSVNSAYIATATASANSSFPLGR